MPEHWNFGYSVSMVISRGGGRSNLRQNLLITLAVIERRSIINVLIENSSAFITEGMLDNKKMLIVYNCCDFEVKAELKPGELASLLYSDYLQHVVPVTINSTRVHTMVSLS